jgi:predicted transposase YdaD
MLLRPKANASDLTGYFELLGADNKPYASFRYTVVRLWEESVEDLISAGPGIAPLALLTNEAAVDLPSAFSRLRERLRSDAVPGKVESVVLGSAYVLCGLRYTAQQIENLYRDLSMTLEDSTTYQLILQKGRTEGRNEGRNEWVALGRVEEAQSLILRLGTKRFDQPPAAIALAIRAIADHERLVRMADRVLDAADWNELLATS